MNDRKVKTTFTKNVSLIGLKLKKFIIKYVLTTSYWTNLYVLLQKLVEKRGYLAQVHLRDHYLNRHMTIFEQRNQNKSKMCSQH